MGLYPPGSTLKPLTAIAALEEGVTTTTEKIRDTGKWTYPGDSKKLFLLLETHRTRFTEHHTGHHQFL